MKPGHVLLASVTLLLVASAVMAQPPGGPPGDFQGGPRGFRGGPPGDFRGGPPDGPGGRGGPGGGPPGGNPSQYIEAAIRNFDANGDGVITPDEVAKLDDGMRARYEDMIRGAGRDPSKPIKVTELRDLMLQQNRVGMAQAMGSRGGPPGAGPGGGNRPGQPPASPAPGFGVEARPVPVARYSPSAPASTPPRLASVPSSSSSSGYSSTPTSGRKSYRLRTAQEVPLPKGVPSWFIEKDVRQCGQITMAEWGAGQEWTDELAADFAKYDLNNDGIVTAEEAVKADALLKAGGLAGGASVWSSASRPMVTMPAPPAADASLEAMYVVPQGSAEEQVKFFQTLSAYKPQTPEEDLIYRANYRKATTEAAEAVLKRDSDPNSYANRAATYQLFMNRIYALAQADPQEQQKLVADLRVYMDERIKHGRGIAAATVAITLGQQLEQMGEYQRAADLLQEFAEMTANSADPSLTRVTDQMRQTAERLAAAANDFHREGQKLVLPPKGRLIPLDLSQQANLDLETFGASAGSGMAEIPRGWNSFAGVKFHVGAKIIQLAGDRPRGGPEAEGRPDKVEGIAVNRKFIRLYVLHSGQWGGAPGMPVGEYRLHYEDGTSTAFPIIYGQDLSDWQSFAKGAAGRATRATVAWTGSNLTVSRQQKNLRLYLSAWDNPNPEKKVTTLDYVSNRTVCNPFCVAMTVESSGQ